MKESTNLTINKILNNYFRFIIWGTGYYYRLYKEYLPEQIVYFVDNDSEKWEKFLDNIIIRAPEYLRNEKNDKTLIIVCNSYFDNVQKQLAIYGKFDVIDIVSLVLIKKHESMIEKEKKNYNIHHSVLICAGIHALWQINGAKKFIDGQLRILHNHGFSTLEIAPIIYFRLGGTISDYFIVNENGKYKGLFTVNELTINYSSFKAIIIHSLYYNYKILDLLLSRIFCEGNILYYLHDYFCICENRFLLHEKILCIDENDNFQCIVCSEKEKQILLQKFHQKLFRDYGIKLIAPSIDTKEKVKKFYTDIPIIELHHLKYDVMEFEKKNHSRIRIAFLGSASWNKGWENFCKLAKKYCNIYDFFCMGNCEDKYKSELITYIVVGLEQSDNKLTMVQALNLYEIDIAYIGSMWPETYSYTYFEAYEAGCFVITTKKSGNVSKQVLQNKNGCVFESLEDMMLWISDEKIVRTMTKCMNHRIFNIQDNEEFIYLLS